MPKIYIKLKIKIIDIKVTANIIYLLKKWENLIKFNNNYNIIIVKQKPLYNFIFINI